MRKIALLVMAVICWGVWGTLRATDLDPQATLTFLKGLAPLRTYETFPFTDAEYLQVAKGGTAFKGREVPGSDLLEGAVARILPDPAWRIWRAVVDEEHHSQYMPQIRFATVLRGKGHGRLIYDFMEIPVISDRQWIVEAAHWGDLWKKSEGRIWLVTFKTPPNQDALIQEGFSSGRLPPSIKELQGDAVTIKESRASYTLIELPDGRTLVEYRAFSDPAGKIPSSILNMGAPSTMKALLDVLHKRALLSDDHYKSHPTLFDPLNRPMSATSGPRPG